MERIKTDGSVLGIDVGWSKVKRTSAVCRLSWDQREIGWEIGRFWATDEDRERVIRQVAGNARNLAVAIDGPLRKGFDEIGRYRSAERLLSRGQILKRIGKPGQSSSPNGRKLNQQANLAAKVVKGRCSVEDARHAWPIDDSAIAEAFPTAFLGTLIDNPERLRRPKQRSDRYFKYLAEEGILGRLLGDLLPDRNLAEDPKTVTNHDDRAALVCAMSALCVAQGWFTAVGDSDDGWIILPPRDHIKCWAWKALHENEDRGDETGQVRAVPGIRERMEDLDPWVLDQATGRWIHLATGRPENEREKAVHEAWQKWHKTGDASDLDKVFEILSRSE